MRNFSGCSDLPVVGIRRLNFRAIFNKCELAHSKDFLS